MKPKKPSLSELIGQTKHEPGPSLGSGEPEGADESEGNDKVSAVTKFCEAKDAGDYEAAAEALSAFIDLHMAEEDEEEADEETQEADEALAMEKD
jgi:hypothetical protein